MPPPVLPAAPPPRPPALAAAPAKARATLPPLPPGVTALGFDEFFVRPIGDAGLVPTAKLRALDGKRVRILGWMVGREKPTPGTLLLTPVPVNIEEDESGFSDLPPACVRVLVPAAPHALLAHVRRPLLLTGTLSVGNRTEPDGSVSFVRLVLDPPPRKQTQRKARSFHAAS